MSDVDPTAKRRGLSRRQVLKTGLMGGAGLLAPWLSACGAPASPTTQAPAPTSGEAATSAAEAPDVAATSAGASADATGTLKIMSWESEEEMRKWRLHIDDFFKTRYPAMTPQLDWGIEWDQYWTKLQATVAGGAQLDMCWMHDSRCQAYASLGLLQPLDEYIAANPPTGWPEEFYPTQVEAFQYQGKQYGIPYDWATGGFYVNLDMLEQAGVEVPTEDWTFNDLLDAALKIQSSFEDPTKQWALALDTGSVGVHWIVKSFGGAMVEGEPLASQFNNPKTVQAFQYLYDAMWKHNIMARPGALAGDIDPFAAGRVAIAFTLNDGVRFMGEAVENKFKWTVAPTPKGDAKRYQFVGGSGFVIPKTAAVADVAYELIRDIASDPENLPVTAEMGSMFVGNSKYWEQATPSEEMVDAEAFKLTFYDLGKRDGVIPVYFPQYQQWDTSVYEKNLSRLWVNETQDVAGVLEQVHQETQALLAS